MKLPNLKRAICQVLTKTSACVNQNHVKVQIIAVGTQMVPSIPLPIHPPLHCPQRQPGSHLYFIFDEFCLFFTFS